MPERNQPANDQSRRGSSSSTRTDHTSGLVEKWSATPARRPLAIAIWSTLLIADVVLIARRVAGEMPLAPPPSLALLSMSFVAVTSFGAWLAFRSDSPRAHLTQPNAWIPPAVSLAIPALWCITLFTQASPLVGGLLLGVLLLDGLMVLLMLGTETHSGVSQPVAWGPPNEITLAVREIEKSAPSKPPFIRSDSPPLAAIESFISAVDSSDADDAFPEDEGLEGDDTDHDDSVTQWMSRRMTDDGELVEGWLRIDFPIGQREATAHVSFCPPLAGPPDIETEDLDGTDLEIRVGSAFPFGARLTARRSGSTAHPATSRIGFVAIVAHRKAA